MSDLATVQNEIKRYGDAAVATKAQVEALAKEIPETKARLSDVEQLLAGGIRGGGNDLTGSGAEAGPTGSLAAEIGKSESFKSFVAGNGSHFKMTSNRSMLERKNTVVDSSNNIVAPERRPGFIDSPERRLRIANLFPTIRTESNLVEATRELAFTNAAAPQAGEGATKPESDLTFELASWKIQTIAHWLKASKQSLADNQALSEFIGRRLEYGVELATEVQLLTGDGTGNNLSGILQTGNHTDYNRTTAADTRLDELRRAATQLALTDFSATGIVVNPADWEAIVLEKDAESRYLLGPAARPEAAAIWGLPVVASNTLSAGQFIVGDFPASGAIFDRQQTVVEMFEQDGTNVQQNLVTVRAECRLCLAIFRPAALIVGSFA